MDFKPKITKEFPAGNPNEFKYFVKFVYDNEVIRLPFCSSDLCRFSEINTHLRKNKLMSFRKVDKWCYSTHIDDYGLPWELN